MLSLYLAVLDDQSNEEQFIAVYNTYKRLVYHTAYKIMGELLGKQKEPAVLTMCRSRASAALPVSN